MNNDLISRNALIQHAYSAVVDGVEKDIIDLSDVDNAPTVENEVTEKQAITKIINSGWLVNHDKELRDKWEIPQGEWIYDEDYINPYRCDKCNYHNDDKTNYCPTCGADMRGTV